MNVVFVLRSSGLPLLTSVLLLDGQVDVMMIFLTDLNALLILVGVGWGCMLF